MGGFDVVLPSIEGGKGASAPKSHGVGDSMRKVAPCVGLVAWAGLLLAPYGGTGLAATPVMALEESVQTTRLEVEPPIECWYHNQFPTLGAVVTPAEDVVRSRLYFRCSAYSDYYFVTVDG